MAVSKTGGQSAATMTRKNVRIIFPIAKLESRPFTIRIARDRLITDVTNTDIQPVV
jgi:hypothetical protein